MSDCFDHAADAWDDLLCGQTYEEGPTPYRSRGQWQPLGRTCKFCGMTDLHWHKVDGWWKLCIKGKPHTCRPKVNQ